MEQYHIPRKLDFISLRECLDKYDCEKIRIRLIGSMGGHEKINETLENRILDFKKTKTNLSILIDSKEVFKFDLKWYDKEDDNNIRGFTLAYLRYLKEDSVVPILDTQGIDPYAKHLPEPRTSVLRHVIEDHLMEISFKGRVNLKYYSWLDKPHIKYWTVK